MHRSRHPCPVHNLFFRDKSFFRMDKNWGKSSVSSRLDENCEEQRGWNSHEQFKGCRSAEGPNKSNHVHLTPSRFPPPPSTYNAVTLPPPLQVSRIYLPRGWFKDSAKLAGGSDNLWGISSGWEFNEPLDGRLIFLYSLDFVLLYCSCVGFFVQELN